VPTLVPASVVERRGCDLNPIDAGDPDGRLTLLSFVWPDQTARFANLAGACDVAAAWPVSVDKDSADTWLAGLLSRVQDGVATVIFHSIMLQYVEPAARRRLLDTIASAGSAATAEAPIGWLRLEPAGNLAADMEVRLTLWPGGKDRRLAVAHPHGTWVRWDAG
jgi:hypothetical protein